MNSLREELATPATVPHEYSLVVPPGWLRLPIDDDIEKRFVDVLMERFRSQGDPRLLTQMRQGVRRSLAELRRRKAVAIHLPVDAVSDVPLPLSIVVLPAPLRSDADIATFRSKLESRGPVSAADDDGRTILRWEEVVSKAGGDEGVSSLTISWLFPAPAISGLRPAIVSGTILYPDGLERDELVLALGELVDAVAGTFTWRRA
jgi:hypothetical protein